MHGMSLSTSKLLLLAVVCLFMAEACQATRTDLLNKSCKSDANCDAPYIVCHEGVCKHKRLFKMTGNEALGLIVMLILKAVGGVVSIAGGVFVVPVAVYLMGFSAGQATALANAIALMTSTAKYSISLFKRNPYVPFKTINDYNGVMAVLPGMTLFSTVGGIVGAYFPEVVVLILLDLLLIATCFTGYFELKKQLRLRKAAAKVQSPLPVQTEDQQNGPIRDTESKPINTKRQDGSSATLGEASGLSPEAMIPEEHRDFIKRQKVIEGMNFYWKKFGFLLVVIALAVLVAVLRGGKGFKSIIGVGKCSAWDWILLVIYGLLLTSLVFYAYYVVGKEQESKEKANWYVLDPNEVKINKKSLIIFYCYCSVVGFVATILGIGGAIVLTPFLLKFKYMPVTTSYVITVSSLISKIASVFIHIVSGDLMTDYTLFFGAIIVIATVLSELAALYTIKRMKSQLIYPIIFITVVIISLIMTTLVGIDKWIKDTSRGISVWKYKGYC